MKQFLPTYYKQLQKDAERYAFGAMKILEKMHGNEIAETWKDEEDLSTSADIKAERFIIDSIKEKYPNHSIYSEEIGEIKGTEPYRWIIDPLDQTKEYVRGLEEYNCLIAVERTEEVIVGVTLHHGLKACFTSSKHNGSYCDGKRIDVSKQSNLLHSFIGFNLPNRKMPHESINIASVILPPLIQSVYRVRPFWDQSKVMSWVAQGLLDGNIAPPNVFKWHDIASSIILVEEAGGTVTDFYNNKVTEKTSKNGVIASNGLLHNKLLDLVKDAQKW